MSKLHVYVSRLKEASHKKKKLFHPKSSSQKEEQKYYEMLLRNLEALARTSWLDLEQSAAAAAANTIVTII